MEFLRYLLIFVCVIVIGLFYEKLAHWDEKSPQILAEKFMTDIIGVCHGIFSGLSKCVKKLFEKEKARHQFEENLILDFIAIAKPYVANGFEVGICCLKETVAENHELCFINIFVPTVYELEKDVAKALTNLEHIKFKEYLGNRELDWETFATYNLSENFVRILLYYAEFKDENEALRKKYAIRLKDLNPQTSGVLRDSALEKELVDVD